MDDIYIYIYIFFFCQPWIKYYDCLCEHINNSKQLAPLLYFIGLLLPSILLFYKLSVNLKPNVNSFVA